VKKRVSAAGRRRRRTGRAGSRRGWCSRGHMRENDANLH
jgi:hypothetical protein